ncbi:MAG: glutamate racemase [Verrucomicrobiota bacterium]
MTADQPLGVFDSGIGGLTVARAIRELLPQESILYLGDTARVPYGNKSSETVIRYAQEDAAFLKREGVKMIIVACNTASAFALEALQSDLEIPVIGVIEPGVEAALAQSNSKHIGIIGTSGTISSGAYQNQIAARQSEMRVSSKATPLLVPLIEEGWLDHSVTAKVLDEYLQPMLNEEVDTLVLACTDNTNVFGIALG